MLQNILNLEGVSALGKKEQSFINGGDTFVCFCGFVGGPFEHLTIEVEADSVGDALNSMNCGGYGSTCNGKQPEAFISEF